MLQKIGFSLLVFAACLQFSQKTSAKNAPNSPAEVAHKIAALFQRFVRIDNSGHAHRPVFLKPHACAKGSFRIHKNLDAKYKVGLFKKATTYSTLVRFSSDASPGTSDHENKTIGMALKLYNVPDKDKVIEHDFLIQNHNVFFSDTAQDFLEFTESIVDDKLNNYLKAHPRFSKVLDDMDKVTKNVLANTYWSPTPYMFGSTYAKYKVIPCKDITTKEPPKDKDNYLRDRLENNLKKNGACFHLQVQLQKDETRMPVDKASVLWSETLSPPVTVATITLPKDQDINRHNKTCENSAFNPGQTLKEHAPAGSINKARLVVYKMISNFRRQHNGVKDKSKTRPITR